MMSSLSNKNKRKGFKQAMSAALPKKIVFSTDDSIGAAEKLVEDDLPFSASGIADISTAAPDLFPRLVPPSELQAQGLLPANIIVTSIDVEEGMHPQRRKKQRADAHVPAVVEEEQIVLDYGAGDDLIDTQREAPSPADGDADRRDWFTVESRWRTLPRVTDASRLQVGSLLGWTVGLFSLFLVYVSLTLRLAGSRYRPCHIYTGAPPERGTCREL